MDEYVYMYASMPVSIWFRSCGEVLLSFFSSTTCFSLPPMLSFSFANDTPAHIATWAPEVYSHSHTERFLEPQHIGS